MATKAEMQAAFECCAQIFHSAAAELQKPDAPAAVKLAETALPHQHAAVSFQRRFQDVAAPAVPIVDLVLQYAPAFFISRSIDAVEAWHEGGTKTERSALPGIPEQIAEARIMLARAVDLWGVLSNSPSAVLRPKLDSRNAGLLHLWLSSALVAVHPHDPTSYFRVSDPRREAVAKCSTCGWECCGPLTDFLEPLSCASCGRRGAFVLLRRVL